MGASQKSEKHTPKRKAGSANEKTTLLEAISTQTPPSKKSKVQADSSARASTAVTTVTDFPRGGATGLTPLEIREISDKVKQDVLFEEQNDAAGGQSASKPGKNAKKRKLAKETAEVEPKPTTTESAKYVDGLNFRKISVGMTIMGCIKEINELDMVVSLPNQLSGFVSITEVSSVFASNIEKATLDDKDDEDEGKDDDSGIPDLKSLYAVGQVVLCSVISVSHSSEKDEKTKTRNRIELSLRPELVNADFAASTLTENMTLTAMVKSKEDHGYVLSFGIDGIVGFLRNMDLGSVQLRVGAVTFCSITKFNKGRRIASVAIDPSTVAAASVQSVDGITYDSLKAGTLVDCKVKSILKNGIQVSFLEFFEGTIEMAHLPTFVEDPDTDLKALFRDSQKIQARILYVDSLNKRIALTLKPYFVELSKSSFTSAAAEFGSIHNQITVLRLDVGKGVFVHIPNLGNGYAHISRLSDSHLDNAQVSKQFRKGSQHTGRIVGLDYCESLMLLSFEKSVLEKKFLNYTDVKIGALIEATIVRIDTFGLILSIAENIRALCPSSHLADVTVSKPEKMFKVGSTIKCRVLSVNPEKRRINVTHKKSLVNSSLKILSSFESAEVGDTAHGTIIKVLKKGCVVSFYGGLKAFAPLAELSTGYIHDPLESFKEGQVVACKVISVSPADKRMRVSFKTDDEAVVATSKNVLAGLEVGQVVNGQVLSKNEEAVEIQLSPSKARAILPKSHISESKKHSDQLLKALSTGAKIDNLVVLRKEVKKGHVAVAHKPFLAECIKAGHVPTALDQIKPNSIIVGYVSNVIDEGCFVAFLGGLSGMVKKHNVSDSFVTDIREHVYVGQTVIATVVSVEESTSRINLSLKPSQCAMCDGYEQLEAKRLHAIFRESDQTFLSNKKASSWTSSVTIGGTVSGAVKQIMPYGVIVEVAKNVTGLITLDHAKSVDLKVGDTVRGKVVDVDSEKKIVDLIIREDAVDAESEADKIRQAAEDKTVLSGIVELIKQDYVVLTVPDLGFAITYLSTKATHAKSSHVSSKYRIGQKINLKLDSVVEAAATGFAAQRIVSSIAEKPTVTLESLIDPAKRAVLNPVDERIQKMEDFELGLVVKGKIAAIKSDQMMIQLGSNVRGRVQVFEIADDLASIPNPNRPFARYQVNSVIDLKVLGFIDVRGHRFLPISHRNAVTTTLVELSVRPAELKLPKGQFATPLSARYPTFESVQIGSDYIGSVSRIEDDYITVTLGPHISGNVPRLELSDDLKVIKAFKKHFGIGRLVKVRVVEKGAEKRFIRLSIRSALIDEDPVSIENIQEGQVYNGVVTKLIPNQGLIICFNTGVYGRVDITDVSDVFSSNPLGGFSLKQYLRCFVISVDRENKHIDLSLRASRLKDKAKTTGFKEIIDLASLEPGTLVQGYVHNVIDRGLIVSIGRHLSAFVGVPNISDHKLPNWKEVYKVGKLVKGIVLKADAESKRVSLALKRSAMSGVKMTTRLKKGDIVEGSVSEILQSGIKIRIFNSKFYGICPNSELSDNVVTSVEKLYSSGDVVKAIVLEYDRETRRVTLGLKASYFEGRDEPAQKKSNSTNDADGDDDEDGDDDNGDDGDEDEEMSEAAPAGSDEDNDDVDDENDDDGQDQQVDTMDIDEPAKPKTKRQPGAASASLGALDIGDYNWDMDSAEPVEDLDDEDDEGDDQDNDEDDEALNKKKSRRQKQREKREEEERIAQREMELLDQDMPPESADDFDRLVVGSPNNSFLWIKYMAFQLQMAEVDKARQVAERALKTIEYREEREKLNVWVALMNLENSYGTNESLQQVFTRAVAHNDPKTVYIHLVKIYERTQKSELAEELYKQMTKKFSMSSKVWTNYGLFLLKSGKSEESRKVLQRSLKSLPKHKHVKTISKFAQMEFRFGEPERGRTIFEGIMGHYPKRIDLWNIYLDMEVRAGDMSITRRLFERVINLKLSSKKMKFFLKKYLDFEKTHGDENGIDHVKQLAMAYVERVQNDA